MHRFLLVVENNLHLLDYSKLQTWTMLCWKRAISGLIRGMSM